MWKTMMYRMIFISMLYWRKLKRCFGYDNTKELEKWYENEYYNIWERRTKIKDDIIRATRQMSIQSQTTQRVNYERIAFTTIPTNLNYNRWCDNESTNYNNESLKQEEQYEYWDKL